MKRRMKIIQRLAVCLKLMVGAGALAAMSFVLILGYDVITQCDYFKTQSIEVIGADRLCPGQVIKQAWLKKGVNTLSVNLSVTRKRLLAHPWISEAEVRRELPSTILIRIKEHKPLAIIDLARKFVINQSGEIFKEWNESDRLDLPIITGLEFSDLDFSTKHCSNPFDAVMAVLKLGQKPGSILPIRSIKRIKVDREIGLTLFAFDQVKTIRLGYNDYQRKYDRLENIFRYFRRAKDCSDFDCIDLNDLDRIVVDPVKIESNAGTHKEV
jgi:cell division protein FtsQ